MQSIYRVIATALAVAAAVLAAPAAAHDIHYSGLAQGAKGSLSIAGVQKFVTLTEVPMACTGSLRVEALVSASVPAPKLLLQGPRGETQGKDGLTHAKAKIDSLSLELPNGLTIAASTLQSHAEASCETSTLAIRNTGGSSLASLHINGQPHPITGETNQEIALGPVGKIIVNEKIQTYRQRAGKTVPNDITYNAMRVVIADARYPIHGEIVFARSRAKVTCSN